MKNILFIHYGGGSIRGSEMCFLSILSLINRSIFAPLVICNQEIMAEKVRAINIPVFRMKIPEITLDGKNSRFQIFLYFQTLYRIAQIIKKNKIDLIYSNSGLPSQMGFPLSKIFNIPLLCHIHARHPKRYAWMWLFKFSNKVIFVSDFVKNDLEKKVKFNGKVRVVYNGVDTEKRFNRNLNLD
ncbi:MAG: glycosyltransferase, partial [Candidatus Dadabacteria bacterium]|nr:glycosyltransferase [Candidatus Dadabacteria bacterium]